MEARDGGSMRRPWPLTGSSGHRAMAAMMAVAARKKVPPPAEAAMLRNLVVVTSSTGVTYQLRVDAGPLLSPPLDHQGSVKEKCIVLN